MNDTGQVGYYIQTPSLHLSYGMEHKWPFQILNFHKIPSYLPEYIIPPQHAKRKLLGKIKVRELYIILCLFLNFKEKKTGRLFFKRCKTNSLKSGMEMNKVHAFHI